MKALVLFSFLFPILCIDSSSVVLAQKDFKPSRRRIVHTGTETSKIDATIIIDRHPKASPQKTYYWFDNRVIHSTRGGYSGTLLNGQYVEYYYPENNLLTKGSFRNGLRHGTWSIWDVNGILRERSEWHNGNLVNLKHLYNTTGQLCKIETYKKGKLHAFQSVDNDTMLGPRIYIHPDTPKKNFVSYLHKKTVSFKKVFHKKTTTQKK